MANPNPIKIDLNDTIGSMRQKLNTLSNDIGGIGSISGRDDGDYSTIVSAINKLIERTDPTSIFSHFTVTGSLFFNDQTGVLGITVGDSGEVVDIENLNGGWITTGTIDGARLGTHDASLVTTGTFDVGRIPVGDLGIPSTTDSIGEAGNLYYTNARSRGAISVDPGSNLTYNNSTGVIGYPGPNATEVRSHLSAGTGVTFSNGIISIGQAVNTSSNVTFANVTLDDITFAGNLTNDLTGNFFALDSAIANDVTLSTNTVVTPASIVTGVQRSLNDLISVVEYTIGGQNISFGTPMNLYYDIDATNSNPYASMGGQAWPDIVELELACISADNGYSVGDVVKLGNNGTNDVDGHGGLSILVNVPNLPSISGRSTVGMQIIIADQGFDLPPKNGGNTIYQLTDGSWSLIVRCIKFNTSGSSSPGALGDGTPLKRTFTS